MPPNTVSVTRPGVFGNPFTTAGCRDAGHVGTDLEITARCVDAFRLWITSPHWRNLWQGPEAMSPEQSLIINGPSYAEAP